MITLDGLAFLCILVGVLGSGAWFGVHLYGVNADEADRVLRFMRGVAVNDEAENGELR